MANGDDPFRQYDAKTLRKIQRRNTTGLTIAALLAAVLVIGGIVFGAHRSDDTMGASNPESQPSTTGQGGSN